MDRRWLILGPFPLHPTLQHLNKQLEIPDASTSYLSRFSLSSCEMGGSKGLTASLLALACAAADAAAASFH
eukprot:scaffold13980_cov18-Tisochrysis_lutea.AAC.1